MTVVSCLLSYSDSCLLTVASGFKVLTGVLQDGPGGTLAHAYFPQFGGDIHVDDSEYWSVQSYKGTNLLQTMVHELGHSLGLSHSDKREAIMAPFYRGWDPFLKLNTDDIRAIRSLYGPKQSGGSVPNIPKTAPLPPT